MLTDNEIYIVKEYSRKITFLEEQISKLTEENERLRAENAKYEAENHAEFNKWLKLEEATKRHHAELFKEAKIAVKEDTVRKMLERIKEDAFSVSLLSNPPKFMLEIREDALDQIAKEMLDTTECKNKGEEICKNTHQKK